MSTYAASVDKTPEGSGNKYSFTVGSGGVTAGYIVKLDSNGYVVACTNAADDAVGFARDTVAAGGVVTVLGEGCLVYTGVALTVGGNVGINGTGGVAIDYASGTYVGFSLAPQGTVLVRIQL
jgi:hypothetical protein